MIRIGTSGFQFKDWVGTVYPEGIRQPDMLRFYEQELGLKTLEVNFTYYTLPGERSMEGLDRKTSDDFRFVVKAFKGMTHEIKEGGRYVLNEDACDRFQGGLAPLLEAGKLICVLAQFPYSFWPDRDSASYLLRLKEKMEDIPLVVEFRNRGWIGDNKFKFLQDNRLGFCIVDEPQVGKLMPFVPRATTDISYLRLHGRNQNWFRVPMEVRYDYLYSEKELKEFVPVVRELAGKTKESVVFFNNCHAGSAAKNAMELLRMLKSMNLEVI